MLLVVRGFGWGVDRVVALLALQTRRHVLGILGSLGSLGSPSLDILVMLLWFDRGP